MKIRVGFGFDVHQLRDNHPFVLGGLTLPHTKGAFGHSDADVLLHVICDALLGAANLRDIGFQFPDTDSALKGVDSKLLLKKTIELVSEKGYSVSNIDCTICLQKPKVNPFIPEMKAIIAGILETDIDAISIKATTTEELGYVGREEGVSAYCVCLISG
ncbi:2-C-methyl-D-erythritol 2,4-cyclodiphosphate synthase [Cryomorpha ignava]|uniref:2-C-methyl-D-erythritol 2,4-cyclodiphosphate synthase n=1 Tax=Cryomorpha ignava TaxID=101383 RepID=A0A7K3WMD4_9FLAO|nr:2-C-methyl-D-erythritol 2,4-cyclodiphosphate synthase [Cryomorpha ignava]NEN22806.1 2-C-methyl-D-erythritol 2,4-cyclodiphosphate synthase [Cryomorpha ignava]